MYQEPSPAHLATGLPVLEVQTLLQSAGVNLADALRQVITSAVGEHPRPVELSRTCGVSKDISYRVLKATGARDPLVAAHWMPGPAPIRELLRGAKRQGVTEEVLGTAERALSEFDSVVRSEAGDRTGLDVMLAGWIPEVRDKVQVLGKQAIFRGMSHIRGVSLQVFFEAAIILPSEDPARCDGVSLCIFDGLRRARPDAKVHIPMRTLNAPFGCVGPLRLDGNPVESFGDICLTSYSTVRPDQVTEVRCADSIIYSLAGAGLGLRSTKTLATADRWNGCLSRYSPTDPPTRSGPFCEVLLPTRLLVFDVFVHESIFPGEEPRLDLFDSILQGTGVDHAAAREVATINLSESWISIGRGLGGVRVPEVPDVVDATREVFERSGADPDEFRGYRCRIEYPPYGTRITMSFARRLPSTSGGDS